MSICPALQKECIAAKCVAYAKIRDKKTGIRYGFCRNFKIKLHRLI